MTPKVVIAAAGGLLLALASGAAAGGTWAEVDNAPGDASFHSLLIDPQSYPGTVALNGATFIVPAPGTGTLVLVGVIGLVRRNRRHRVHT